MIIATGMAHCCSIFWKLKFKKMTLCSICSNKCILHYCLSSKICSPYPVCTTILNSRTFHPLLFYVKWEIIVLCDLMLQNTLYRNYSSKSVLSFISSLRRRGPDSRTHAWIRVLFVCPATVLKWPLCCFPFRKAWHHQLWSLENRVLGSIPSLCTKSLTDRDIFLCCFHDK